MLSKCLQVLSAAKKHTSRRRPTACTSSPPHPAAVLPPPTPRCSRRHRLLRQPRHAATPHAAVPHGRRQALGCVSRARERGQERPRVCRVPAGRHAPLQGFGPRCVALAAAQPTRTPATLRLQCRPRQPWGGPFGARPCPAPLSHAHGRILSFFLQCRPARGSLPLWTALQGRTRKPSRSCCLLATTSTRWTPAWTCVGTQGVQQAATTVLCFAMHARQTRCLARLPRCAAACLP